VMRIRAYFEFKSLFINWGGITVWDESWYM